MDVRSFFARALKEGERYGEDPYVFLRELAQNARDGGASRIDLTVEEHGGEQSILFQDNGSGMTLEHARAFLFRLYASSKEGDPDSVGHFGVGFWSVLRWRPDEVRVESRVAGGAWSVSVDGVHGAKIGRSRLRQLGTRITLRRRLTSRTEPVSLLPTVRDRMGHYCRYLRTADRRPRVLPIHVNGVRIDTPMEVDGPVSLRFERGRSQGVVGLGDTPRVELYSRGLLVKRATVLEELEPGGQLPKQASTTQGLAPVVILNCDSLDVVMSRQEPLDSRDLRRLVCLARREVRRLVDRLADRACPLPWHLRLRDAAARLTEGISATAVAGVVGVWALAATMIVYALSGANPATSVSRLGDVVGHLRGPIHEKHSSVPDTRDEVGYVIEARVADAAIVLPPQRAYGNVHGYQGPRVDVPTTDAPRWALQYQGGPPDLLFKTLTLNRYDAERGWMRGSMEPKAPAPAYACDRRCIDVRLVVSGGPDWLVIPLPTGYLVEPHSLAFRNRELSDIRTNALGETLVQIPVYEHGALTYRAGPEAVIEVPKPHPVPPAVVLPVAWERRVQRALRLNPRRRVPALARWVQNVFAYDISPSTAQAFQEAQGDWVQRVAHVGAGDCDIKNGVNVLLLRHAGVPARMAVGIPTQNRQAESGLHAWTEYYQHGWRGIDVTGGTLPDPPPSVSGVSAPPALTLAPLPSREGSMLAPQPSSLSSPDAVSSERVGWGSGIDAKGLGEGAEVVDERAPPAVPVLMLLGVLSALAGAAWLRWRGRERFLTQGAGDAERQALARLVRDALSHPALWRSARNLWHRRLLPTLEGRPMSVSEAARRGSAGRLWVTRKRSPLARAATRARRAVLDGSDPVFGDVISALGRAVDLDTIDPLKPVPRTDLDPGLGALLAATDEVLGAVGTDVRCAPCPRLEQHVIRDVDLADLKLGAESEWPRRYIAINPRAGVVRDYARLALRDPCRAAFVWLDWLSERSELLADRAARVRERAAQVYLKNAA